MRVREGEQGIGCEASFGFPVVAGRNVRNGLGIVCERAPHYTRVVTAAIFLLRARGAGAIVGAALVCPTVRYCSVRARGTERFERRFATPADWKAIESELRSLPSGPLPSESAIARVVAGRDLDVTYLMIEKLADVAPGDVAVVLDRRLRALPLNRPSLTLEP